MTVSTSVSRAGPSGYDPPNLHVSVRSEDPSAFVIEVQGELDLFTGPMLQRHLEAYNNPNGNNGHPRRVTYLLPELKFMDASGLRALLTAVDGHGSETITIREPSSSVCRLLQLAGLDSMIEERANQ
ncbi:MAG TPA: STAS domain-containing protein [Acidimicrobiia bacterium]|nr:STAS domain-containing protein [Acidimicrobiia bacterium]